MTSSSFFPCSHPASYQTKLRQLQEYDDPPLDLASSLNDSFGWDDVNGTDVDDEFERLYEEPQPPLSQPSSQPSQTYSQPRNEQRIHRTSFNYRQDHRYRHRYEEETQLSSSVGLNPYSVGSAHHDGRQSIFRSNPSHPAKTALPSPSSLPIRHVNNHINPNKSTKNSNVVTPNSYSSTTPKTSPTSILRNPTAVSSFTQTTVTSPSRHRSRSRSSRRGGSDVHSSSHRSRSRHGRSRNDEDHHESLFRGAQLIKEQLIRSMTEVDRVREEEERRNISHSNVVSDKQGISSRDSDVTMDFDYSQPPHVSSSSNPNIEVVRNSSSMTDPSSIQSRLESESQRLDTLIKIFAQGSSIGSENLPQEQPSGALSEQHSHQQEPKTEQQVVRQSSSDKENNEEYPHDEEAGNSTASPKSICVDDLNRAATVSNATPSACVTKSFFPQSSEESEGNNYAKQYFEKEDERFKNDNDGNTIVYADSPVVAPTQQKQLQLPSRQQQPIIQSSPSQLNLQYHQQKQKQHRKQSQDALSHARSAGSLWRSLVSNHVRFPSSWEDLLPPSCPPITSPSLHWSKWYYTAKHRVRGDAKLNSRKYGVRTRRSGGRILMNLLVREMHSTQIVKEIAVGCYHPNAGGIRCGEPVDELEDVREVWLGVRWLIPNDQKEVELSSNIHEEDVECYIDGFLTQKRHILDYPTMGSPLGHRKAVNNENVRAVFGDQPPLTTVNLYEDELAEILKANDNAEKKLSSLPALMLLKLFLFSK